MKSKKGFTLVELLGAIVILAILSLIAIPAVTNVIKSNKQKLYDIQIKNVETAAKAWASDNLNLLPDEGEYITISLSELQKGGYVDKKIKNPKTGEALEDFSITICNIDNQYTYKKDGECEVPIESDATLTSLKVNGEEVLTKEDYTVSLPSGTTSIEITAKAKNEKATITGTGTPTVSAGTNTFGVNVTSEDGKKQKKYTIKVMVDNSVAEIPTASYCKTGLVYTGNSQTLTKEPGTGYTFTKKEGTDAGSYTVEAVLSKGYKWSGNTTGTKTISCSIDQATPTITLSSESGTVTYGTSSKTFTVETSIDGIISLSADNDTAIESFTVDTSSSNKYNVTVSNLGNISAGTTVKVTIKFTPTDTTNYNTSTATYTLTINKAKTATTGSCASLTYNGSSQTLASGGKYVSYTNNTQTDADDYEVTVNADSNHTFNDGSTSQTLTCSIAKVKPTITLSSEIGSVDMGQKITFTEKANVAGSFLNETANSSIATVSPKSYSNVDENTEKTVAVRGEGIVGIIPASYTTIKISFTPSSKNYEKVDAEYYVYVYQSDSSDGAKLQDLELTAYDDNNNEYNVTPNNFTVDKLYYTTSVNKDFSGTLRTIFIDAKAPNNASITVGFPDGSSYTSENNIIKDLAAEIYPDRSNTITITVELNGISNEYRIRVYSNVATLKSLNFKHVANTSSDGSDSEIKEVSTYYGFDSNNYNYDLYLEQNPMYDACTDKTFHGEDVESAIHDNILISAEATGIYTKITLHYTDGSTGSFEKDGYAILDDVRNTLSNGNDTNKIEIEVTAEDGITTNTYTINVYRYNQTCSMLSYHKTDGGVIVDGFGGISYTENLIIPSTLLDPDNLYNPLPVIGIANDAFSNQNLISVELPNSVTTIGNGAFGGNNLTSVTIPDSVTTIGNNAFDGNQLSSVTIGNSVTDIGMGAFGGNNLTSVTIPDSVKTIGEWAFYINNITDIDISDYVETIEWGAFNDNQLPIEQAFIYARNIDGTEDTTKIVSYGGAERESVDIPSNVLTIGGHSFANNSIENINIPSNVSIIEEYAFENNYLTYLYLPNSVINIGNSAFHENKLSNFTIPDSVITIGEAAFECNDITSVTLGKGVSDIGNFAFYKGKSSEFDSNPKLTSIGNPTGKSFNWGSIINGESGFEFINGIVENDYGNVEVTGIDAQSD